MNFKLELPEGTFLINREELKEVIYELLEEVNEDHADEEIMTIREAAEYLKVSVPTIRNMITNKEIPFFQRGQVIRLNRSDLKEWIRKKAREQ